MHLRNALVGVSLAMVLLYRADAGEVIELPIDQGQANLIRPFAFTVHNAAAQGIAFYLSADREGWTRHRLNGEELREFSDGASSRYVIEIPTRGATPVRYQIAAGKRYQIYWNEPARRWDMMELLSR